MVSERTIVTCVDEGRLQYAFCIYNVDDQTIQYKDDTYPLRDLFNGVNGTPVWGFYIVDLVTMRIVKRFFGFGNEKTQNKLRRDTIKLAWEARKKRGYT